MKEYFYCLAAAAVLIGFPLYFMVGILSITAAVSIAFTCIVIALFIEKLEDIRDEIRLLRQDISKKENASDLEKSECMSK